MTTSINANNTSTSSIQFRSKFKNLVTDENRQIITSVFEDFCQLDPTTDEARDILWGLTYSYSSSCAILKRFGLDCKECNEFIDAENILKLRDELRHQYEKINNGYLLSDVPQECLSEFNEFAKKADTITASVVYEHCLYHLSLDDVVRTLFLLKSDMENYYFGGIRNLGFTIQEAEYLKCFSILIYNLLKVMSDYMENNKNTKCAPELPFTFEIPAAETFQPEQPSDVKLRFKALNSESILEQKELFNTFIQSKDMNILLKIGSLDFDLNKVLAKIDAISKVLCADGKRESANKLLKEAEELQEASRIAMAEAEKDLST